MKWLIWKSDRGWHAGRTRGTPLYTSKAWILCMAEVNAMIAWTIAGAVEVGE